MKHIILAALVGMLVSGPAWAEEQPPTASDMRLNCSAAVALVDTGLGDMSAINQANLCLVFMQTAANAFDYMGIVLDVIVKNIPNSATLLSTVRRQAYSCTGDANISNIQRIKIWLKWVDSHPEKLHFTPTYAYSRAMMEAFPCK